jgi:hypothetical protein
MIQIKPQNDSRFDNICCYCQNYIYENITRDHVPSKVLLESPFPENLPVVFCCYDCNQNFSTDEEYFACMIEYICSETADIELFERVKIREILNKKKHLRKRIEDNLEVRDGVIKVTVEMEAINKIIKKLIYGHLAFEFANPYISEPDYIIFNTLDKLSPEDLDLFFSTQEIEKAPELGSRSALVMTFYNNVPIYDWKIVQDDIYHYKIDVFQGVTFVKILIRNKICIMAEWQEKSLV